MRIDRLRAQAFRGLSDELVLELSGRNLLLYGDNGSGKSPIVESLEYAATGDVKSLSKRGQRISLRKHGPNVACDPSLMQAEIALSGQAGSGSLAAGRPVGECGEEIEQYAAGASDGSFILRRRQLLQFIEAVDDKSRYEMLRPFLALDEFEAFERTLKEAAAAINVEARQKAAELQRQEELARVGLGIEAEESLEAEALLASVADDMLSLGLTPPPGAPDAAAYSRVLRENAPDKGRLERQMKLQAACSSWQELVAASDPMGSVDALLAAVTEREKQEATFPLFRETVLTEGREWIESEDLQRCPLCEQSINREAVLLRLEERLQAASGLVNARDAAASAIRTASSWLDRLAVACRKSREAWQEVGLQCAVWPGQHLEAQAKDLNARLGQPSHSVAASDLRPLLEALAGWDAVRKSLGVSGALSQAGCDSSGGDPDRQTADAVAVCTWVFEELPELTRLREKSQYLTKMAALADCIHDAAEKARKDACSEIFAAMEGDVRAVYEFFHPDEELGGLEMRMKDSVSGSVVLRADFGERVGEDPRAYYSEAHQDTLGLTIFIALRRAALQRFPEFDLVVFDDVLSSIDAAHRARVAKYVVEELSKQMQVMVTTHDHTWYRQLVESERRAGLKHRFMEKRIISFSRDTGPRVVDMAGDYDRLTGDLSAVGHEEYGIIAGRLLDDLMQETRFGMRLAVPAARGERYPIGDIWPSFLKRAKKYADVETAALRVNDSLPMRNLAAHSELTIKGLSRAEVTEFARAVVQLYDTLFCHTCGTFVERVDRPRDNLVCKRGCLQWAPGNS